MRVLTIVAFIAVLVVGGQSYSHAQVKWEPAAIASVLRVVCSTNGLGGSGFLHKSGKVITAEHVVDGCESALVLVPSSGDQVGVKEVAVDKARDLAVLTPKSALVRPTLSLSNQGKLSVSSQVSTWGFPEGYRGREALLSMGYVSGEDRPTGRSMQWVVNAAFNNGNSGGPLVSISDGTIVGVVVSKLAPLPIEIESALAALKSNNTGMTLTARRSDGTTVTVTESQVVGMVLFYLRQQTQLVIGYAVKSSDLRAFLHEQGIDP